LKPTMKKKIERELLQKLGPRDSCIGKSTINFMELLSFQVV